MTSTHTYSFDQRKYLSEVLKPLDFDKSDFQARQTHIKNVLARYLNLKTVVALVGAGASIPIGYPSWNSFAEDILNKTKLEFPEKSEDIERYLKYVGDGKKEMSAQVLLEECERLYTTREGNKNKQSDEFRKKIRDYFEIFHKQFSTDKSFRGKKLTAQQKLSKEHNPYIALLKLPIRRFITTNYDFEIERALLAEKKIPNDLTNEEICSLDLDGQNGKCIVNLTSEKSFLQRSSYCEKLAQFPISRYEDSEYTVFHCHGRIDDINSCVVTEDDFQEWYLREKPECLPFRQTLDLTLGSNPILIIGYGLGDLDLTRWLRTIAANRPYDKVRNPLFCLNYIRDDDFKDYLDEKSGIYKPAKWRNEKEVEDECDALYLRYGLHVIPVYEKNGTLCDELIRLEAQWRDWWNGILMKPMFRKTPSQNFNESSYYHYKIDFSRSSRVITTIQEDLEKKLDELLKIDEENLSGLAIVVGDGGTGKSWSVQKYLQDKEKKAQEAGDNKKKFIFWSSYYANDVLTGIDRLIEYLEFYNRPSKNKTSPDHEYNNDADTSKYIDIEDRFEKLSYYLSENKDLIVVFDGIEKLLKPNKKKTEGESISPEIKRFFKIISEPKNHCKIILTTRLFPIDVLEAEDNEQISRGDLLRKRREDIEVKAPRCWSKDLLKNGFSNLITSKTEKKQEQKFSELCSLVDGHTLCISLIQGILEDFSDKTSALEKLEGILRDIGNTPIDRRIYRVIKTAINHLDDISTGENIFEKFIERISLFMHPVREDVARICYEDALGDKAKTKLTLENVLETLVKKNLLQEVFLEIEKTGNISFKGYIVHPLIRNYIYQNLHKSLFTSLPSIQLSGLTSAMEVVDPGSKERGVEISAKLFNKLCESARKPYESITEVKPVSPISQNDKKIYMDFCRGAYSILRSRFCANTVTRWGDYREYLKMLLNLYDTSRMVSEDVWKYNEPTSEGRKHTKSNLAPLYADEIAWIYNEIGLASIGMGNLLNAIPFREQGLEINKLIDRDKDGRYLFQSEFNLGVAYIHLGRLNFALNYLERAIEIGNKLDDTELVSRVKAYIALIKYLQGSLEEADQSFNDSYKGLGENPRAKGIFYCYHGELLLKLGKVTDAGNMISQSLHIGESCYYPDLVAYARLAKGNLLLRDGDSDEAQNEFNAALRIAKETKIRRLETGILSAMSRLSYHLNDSETARQKAVEALKIANEYSLCLHQTTGLIVLGKALIKSGQRDLGIAFLKSARTMSKSQSYFLRMNEANKELEKHS